MTLAADPDSLGLLCKVLSPDPHESMRALSELSATHGQARLLAIAEAERVVPALNQAIVNCPGCFEKSDRILLALACEVNRKRNRKIRNAVLELAAAADRHSIELLVLKGARWILEDADGCAAWRSMLDIDILVRAEQLEPMLAILAKLDYCPTRRERDFFGKRRFAGHYHLVAHRRDNEPYFVEVHRHIGYQPYLLPTEALFNLSRPLMPGLRTPCLWHAALHAIIHWQLHHFGHTLGFHRVTDGLDIARFLGRDDVDWDVLNAHAARVGISREVAVGVAAVAELFGLALPAPFELTDEARRYVSKALLMRQSRLLKWQAKQQQRIERLWHDHRFLYRANLRHDGPASRRRGLWALRLRRMPFLASHLGSIAILQIAMVLQRALVRAKQS